MPDRDPRRFPHLPLLSALLLAGCAHNTAPADFLPSPQEARREGYGGWLELTVREGPKRTRGVAGELLAVSEDTLLLLGDSGVTAISTATVRKGRLTGYRSSAGLVGSFAALGTLATVSNGYFLVFTAPMWIIGGTIAAGTESTTPVIEVPPPRWQALAAWARFPQGIPPGLDPGTLTRKPKHSR